MKKEYVVAHYAKEGVFPKILPDTTYNVYIQNMIATGVPGSVEECSDIPSSAWADLRFAQNHVFNYFEMPLDIMEDKSIAPPLDNIYQLFAQDALDVIGKLKQHPLKNTRLIIELLSRDVIDVKKFYETVTEYGYVPQN